MLLCIYLHLSSASGAALLVRCLPRLQRLAFQNMRRVLALLILEAKPGQAVQYGLDYLDSTDHNGEHDQGVEDGSYWASGKQFSLPFILSSESLLENSDTVEDLR